MVRNNVIYRNHSGGHGLRIVWGTEAVVVVHNTISGNSKGFLLGTPDAFVHNNIIFNNTVNFTDEGTRTDANDNLFTNPSFANPNAGDFRLLQGSSAIDAGVALPDVKQDLEGNPRPIGTGWDIGAYEFTQAPAAPSNLRLHAVP